MHGEKIYFFDDCETVNAVFAANLTTNIRNAEKKLNVQMVTRDSWVKILTDDTVRMEKAIAFLNELKKTYMDSSSRVIPQQDFEHILSAFEKSQEKVLKKSFNERIIVSPRKNDIIPKNKAQLNYVSSIRKNEIVFGIGPAGTGKTYLAMAMAVSQLLEQKQTRIILTRPAREAGETLGFLPGNLEEKILPYLRPLYDALYDMLEFDEAAVLMEKDIIEIAPLAFMRGRTLNNAFIILDEAQNTTSEQMLMLLTRIGFNSRCVITGDPSQTDLAKGTESGLVHAGRILKNIPEISFCHFSTKDIVRHSLIEKIVHAYQNEKKKASNGHPKSGT